MTQEKIAILWGSETGTAQGLAEQAEMRLEKEGIPAEAIDMSDISLEQLKERSGILVLTSTWGDGDPPSNAIQLWEDMQSKQVDLSAARFSVCALGDTAYYQFCKCGKDFDEYLEKLGAKRIQPLQECDLDYDMPFAQWLDGVVSKFKNN